MADDKKKLIGIGAVSFLSAILVARYLHKQLAILHLRHQIKTKWVGNEAFDQIKLIGRIQLELDKYKPMKFYYKIKAPEEYKVVRRVFDPFTEDNSRAMFITHLSPTHNLIFNKYWVSPYHVLIITKEFVVQNTPLTFEDFVETLKVMKALKGFAFFNSGPKAGASQTHKHIQAIPYNSYPNSKIPIDVLIGDKKGEYFSLPQFKFQHLFFQFNKQTMKQITRNKFKEVASTLQEIYKTCLKKLNNEDLAKEYNIILTNRWLVMVLRSAELTEHKIKINAMGFTGSFLIDQKEVPKLISEDPFSILAQVSYPLHHLHPY